MYITGKGLSFIISDQKVEENQVVDYALKRNPINNCRFFGIVMLIVAAYFIVVAIGVLISNSLMVTIATLTMAVIGVGAAIYYYTANSLKAKGVNDNGRDKNVKN